MNAQLLADCFHLPNLAILLRVFALGLPFMALYEIFIPAFQAFKRADCIALFQGFILPFSMIIIYLLLLFSGGNKFISLGFTYLISYLLFSIIVFKILFSFFEKGVKPAFHMQGDLLHFSLPMMGMGLFSLTQGQINTLVLGWFRTAVEIGIFGIVFKLSLLCVVALVAVNHIFAPIIADLHNQFEIKKLEKIFKSVSRWIFILSLPIFFCLIINSKLILQMFGKNYSLGATPLIILCIGQLIYLSAGSAAAMLIMTGKSYLALFNAIFLFILNLSLSLLLIPHYGVVGAAIAYAVSLSAMSLIRLLQVYWLLKIFPYNLKSITPIFIAAAIISSIYLLRLIFSGGIIESLVYTILGLMVYIFIMVYTIHEEDKQMLVYVMGGPARKARNIWKGISK